MCTPHGEDFMEFSSEHGGKQRLDTYERVRIVVTHGKYVCQGALRNESCAIHVRANRVPSNSRWRPEAWTGILNCRQFLFRQENSTMNCTRHLYPGYIPSSSREGPVRLGGLMVIVLVAIHAAWGVDPATHLTQYSHTVWRMQDGFFTGAPTAIAQTSDGYLWVGTANGLFRFDGIRFVPWAALAHQKELESAEVSSLLGARDGSLWIGAAYRLLHWKDNTLSQYSTKDRFVSSIIQTRKGSIWLTRTRYSDEDGALCQVKDRGIQKWETARHDHLKRLAL